MRARSLTTALTVLCAASAIAVAVPAAFATAPSGHGKPAATGKGHPKHTTAGHGKLKLKAQLVGKVTSVGDAQFVLHVKGGHLPHHGKDVTVLTTDKTVIKYHGHHILLSQVPVGAKVTTKVALFGDGTVFAIWVNVNGGAKLVPLPSASPSPSVSPTPASTSPSDSESPSPSDTPSASASS
ncbi:MAG TPA: hypothetical protein VHE83_16340 [Mycobacteriales bacterium]|nr:hypothetical protein [Mycobacteriales bacterium]